MQRRHPRSGSFSEVGAVFRWAWEGSPKACPLTCENAGVLSLGWAGCDQRTAPTRDFLPLLAPRICAPAGRARCAAPEVVGAIARGPRAARPLPDFGLAGSARRESGLVWQPSSGIALGAAISSSFRLGEAPASSRSPFPAEALPTKPESHCLCTIECVIIACDVT